MERFRGTKIPKSNTAAAGSGISPGLAVGGAGLVAATATQGAGGTTVTSCPSEDNSFYCKFVKGFNIFKMILVILIIVGVIAFMAWFFWPKGRKPKTGARK